MKLRLFDIVAIVFSLVVFLIFTAYGRSLNQEDGYVIIESSGEKHIYPLSEDRDLVFQGPVGESVIHIEQGAAGFLTSDCDDSLCVQMGVIQSSGEWAACLPNKVFIYTGGNEDDQGVDSGVY